MNSIASRFFYKSAATGRHDGDDTQRPRTIRRRFISRDFAELLRNRIFRSRQVHMEHPLLWVGWLRSLQPEDGKDYELETLHRTHNTGMRLKRVAKLPTVYYSVIEIFSAMQILPALFFVALLLGSPSLHAGLRLGSVELSPLRVLTLLDAGDVHSMAGGVYFRSTDGTHELAMPIAWYADKRTPAYDCCDTTVFRIDFQWRDFGSENFSGRYHGPVFRLARVSGTEYRTDEFNQFEHGRDIAFGRAGVGWVVGYRVPNRRLWKSARIYWGFNVSAGVYLDQARDLELRGFIIPHIETAIESRGQFWINLELLKLGFIF